MLRSSPAALWTPGLVRTAVRVLPRAQQKAALGASQLGSMGASPIPTATTRRGIHWLRLVVIVPIQAEAAAHFDGMKTTARSCGLVPQVKTHRRGDLPLSAAAAAQ